MFKRLIVSLLLLAVMLPAFAQDEPEDTRFFLTFVPNIQFAPFYVMIGDGHAADAGFNLLIEHGDENVGADLIASGEIDFGVISGEQVILARAGGRPLVYFYEWFQEYPVGIVVPDTTEGVETVEDLEGLRVGIPGRFGASYSGLTALLGVNELQESDISLEPIGFAAPDVVCAGAVDASVIYVNNEPLQIQQRADVGECGNITDLRVFYVSDQADMVSNGLVTNEDLIQDSPERVQAFAQAFDLALQASINNPAQAYLTSLEYVEGLPISDDLQAALEAAAEEQAAFLADEPDRELIAESREALLADLQAEFAADMLTQFNVLIETIALWDAGRLGYTDPESWVLTQEVLETLDMLTGDVNLRDAYTNDFVPGPEAVEAD